MERLTKNCNNCCPETDCPVTNLPNGCCDADFEPYDDDEESEVHPV